MDTTELESGYRRVLAALRDGPPQAQQGQDQPVEHEVAAATVTARLLAMVCAGARHGRNADFDDALASDPEYLDALARGAGDWDGLVAALRGAGLELVLMSRGLDPEQAATIIHARRYEGDEVRVDGPVPLSGVLATYAEVDLPALAARFEGGGS